jgi:dolichol-phosphate mannosyltransferase
VPVSPDPSAAATRTSRLALALILGSGIFHLLYAAWVGLAGDEAYYWQWARHPDFGYFDHPPFVAYLIAGGTRLAGQNEFGVRLAVVLLSTAMLWLTYRITVNYARASLFAEDSGIGPESAGLWAVAALAATPLFSLGGFLATPDAPMVFFWTLSIALVLQALRNPRPRYWALLGAALGLGMLSKYSMAVLPLSLLAAFAITPRGRELLRTPGPVVAAATAFMVLVPHLLWLARHDFAPVLFQLGHGLAGSAGEKTWASRLGTFAQFVAGQFGVLTPLLFAVFMAALGAGIAALRRRRTEGNAANRERELATWLLVLPAGLTLVVFALASLATKSQTNWPAAAYPTLSVFAGVLLARWMRATRTKRVFGFMAVGLAALVSLYAHIEVAHPLVPYGSSVFDKLQERKGMVQWVQTLRAESEEKKSAAVLADNYRTASLLAFYLPDHPQTDAPFETGSGSQYILWRNVPDTASGMGWYITRFADDPRIPTLFSDSRYAGSYVERRAGIAIGTTHVWYGRLHAAIDRQR